MDPIKAKIDIVNIRLVWWISTVTCFYLAAVGVILWKQSKFRNKLCHQAWTKSLNIYHLGYSLIYPQPLRPQMEIPKLYQNQGTS